MSDLGHTPLTDEGIARVRNGLEIARWASNLPLGEKQAVLDRQGIKATLDTADYLLAEIVYLRAALVAVGAHEYVATGDGGPCATCGVVEPHRGHSHYVCAKCAMDEDNPLHVPGLTEGNDQ